VFLLPATKGVPADVIREASALGLRDFGENRVQEAMAKAPLVPDVAWHGIGRLQTNKAAKAVAIFQAIESVDRPDLALKLDRAARERGRTLDILVEVNTTGESQKGGVAPGGLEALLEEISTLHNLRPRGLMTIAGRDEPARSFALLARLREKLRPAWPELTELSMGMSGDFEEAIRHGATIVRVGQALFGPRTT